VSSDFWATARATTPARIGVGRVGNAQPTAALLDFGAAHAAARDAIHQELDLDALTSELALWGIGDPVVVPSAVQTRGEYLRRPDLGRVPGVDLAERLADVGPADVALVLADGLSAEAVSRHAGGVVHQLLPAFPPEWRVSPPLIATQARVALGDHIGAALGARMVLVLIGERPGLSSSDSLGAYLTWAPQPGSLDSARNCISNIRPPDGLDYETAAHTIVSLMRGAAELGATGVGLKARSDTEIAN
jgi:ethanolamine ammonia-lyase small subunit